MRAEDRDRSETTYRIRIERGVDFMTVFWNLNWRGIDAKSRKQRVKISTRVGENTVSRCATSEGYPS